MRLKTCSFTALLLLSATPAWALDMEYYTYGGYSAIVLAFQKIALIFSDAGYNALFYVVIVAAIFVGTVKILMGVAGGRPGNLLSWAPPVLLGLGIYLALVVPKGTLTVYDPLMNRFQTIGGIPNGLVMVAGTLNKIERGLVDIIDTSGTVDGYQRSAGGMGFNMLYQATNGGFGLGNTYIGASLRRYAQDCVVFEMMRPGSSLTSESLASQSTNALTEFALAASPAVWTVYYDSTFTTGQSMSCSDAFNNYINPFLSDTTNLTAVVTQACSGMGFNTSNATELTRCQQNLSDFTSYLYGGAISVSPEVLMRQVGMMEALDNVLKAENPDMALRAMSNRGIMTSGISMGLVANDWLPVMRAVFTAVAIGLVPFLCLFLPTGVIGKAAGLITGFFVWLTCWGITDAILHGIATDYAYQAMDYIRANNLGYNAIMLFPSYIEKALAMFGFVRTAGIMLATIMTSMLVSFGGHALAMMAGNIQGTLQSQAGAAGMAAADPIGGMRARQELYATTAQQGTMEGWDNLGKAKWNAARTMGHTGFENQYGNALGQNDVAKALGESVMDLARGNVRSNVNTMQGNIQHVGALDGAGNFRSVARNIGGDRDITTNYDNFTNQKGQELKNSAGSMQFDREGQLVSATLNNKAFGFNESDKNAISNSLTNQVARKTDYNMSYDNLYRVAKSSGVSDDGSHKWALAMSGSYSQDSSMTHGTDTSQQHFNRGTQNDTARTGVGLSVPGVAGGPSVGLERQHQSAVGVEDSTKESSGVKSSRGFKYNQNGEIVDAGGHSWSVSSSEGLDLTRKISKAQGWSDVDQSTQQLTRMQEAGSSESNKLNHLVIKNVAESSEFRSQYHDKGDRYDAASIRVNSSGNDDSLVQNAFTKAKADYIRGSFGGTGIPDMGGDGIKLNNLKSADSINNNGLKPMFDATHTEGKLSSKAVDLSSLGGRGGSGRTVNENSTRGFVEKTGTTVGNISRANASQPNIPESWP